jgi:putative membrane protein
MGGRFFGPGWHGGFQLFGGLFGIVLFALFIGLLVWALMRLMNHDHARHAPVGGPWQARDEALNAARMRYARGELDRDQYFRLVEDLTGVPRPADPAAPANPSGTTMPPYPAPPTPPAADEPGTPPQA